MLFPFPARQPTSVLKENFTKVVLLHDVLLHVKSLHLDKVSQPQKTWDHNFRPNKIHLIKILDFSFCLFGIMATNTQPRDIVSPVWPQKSVYMAYEASTNHFMMLRLSTLNISGMYNLYLIYCSIHCSLIQLSLSGFLTIVVRNSTAVYMSFLF